MKKTFKLEELDCANCAARMEAAINKIKEVNSAAVSFMASSLTLDADDEIFEQALEKAEKAIRRVDFACRVVR